MDGTDSISLAALLSHPIQYQVPLFKRIADYSRIDLTVYYCSKRGYDPVVDPGFEEEIAWDRPLLEGYDHVFLKNYVDNPTKQLIGDLNPGIFGTLRKANHDVLWIHGYNSATNWLALFSAAAVDLPVVFRGESTLLDPPSFPKQVPKQVALRLLDIFVDAYGIIGTHNREFYRNLSVDGSRLFHTPYSVDNDYFQKRREALPSSQEIRRDLSLPSGPIVLFVGKLIERKRPNVLLKAFVESTAPGEATLLYVGDGEQRSNLEKEARRHDRMDDIRFVGFKNQSELPRFYEASDLFVLPSAQENWGLVVNEAMNFELPIITTDAVGSSADLVTDNNGLVVPVDDVDALGDSIHDTLFERDREQMGANSLAIIEEWGIDSTAEGILAAARFVA